MLFTLFAECPSVGDLLREIVSATAAAFRVVLLMCSAHASGLVSSLARKVDHFILADGVSYT